MKNKEGKHKKEVWFININMDYKRMQSAQSCGKMLMGKKRKITPDQCEGKERQTQREKVQFF